MSRRRDWPFFAGLAILSGVYILLIVAMLVADLSFTTPHHLLRALASPEIQYSIKLSRVSCTLTFDQISPRCEQVALTLGCNRSQAFWRVALPEARRGVLTAATLAWARALGEFGPILVFSGATRLRTEVLPTSVFLELSIGNIEAAVAVSLIMIVAALAVLTIVRLFGLRAPLERVL